MTDYNEKKATHAVNFIQKLKHTKGKWAGKPFDLRDWQKQIIKDIFGRLNSNGKREIRTVYIELPRKNGKSELAAAIALKLLFADKEKGAEIYSCAGDREQASLVFNVAAQMVRESPELSKRSKIIDSQKRIVVHKTFNVYRALSAESYTKHGLNAHGVIFDELHVQPNRELWDVMETSKGAREQPLTFAITTAGTDRESVCYQLHEYSEKILNGVVNDPTFYPVIYAAAAEDDWTDEAVWHKCNPALGDFRFIDEMRASANRAKEIPAEQNTFRRLYLNQWTQQSTRWIDLEVWENNYKTDVNINEMRGRIAFGGIDLSSVADITAWCLLFPDNDGVLNIHMRFWCSESVIYSRRNKYADQYQSWVRQGFLTMCPGEAIEYNMVRADILVDIQKCNVESIAVDRLFQGYEFTQRLNEDMGGTEKKPRVFSCGMGFFSMAGPCREFESRLLKRQLNHGNNPVLRFMADSVSVSEDPAGNKKPNKDKSQGKIDGIVAVLLALDRHIRYNTKRPGYADRGVIFI